jgi:hypothetical protein
MEVLAREKALRPAIRSGLSAQHSAEAKEMGQHLGKHLIAVRGGGFFDLFTKGIVEAGQQGESFAKQTGEPNANPPPPPTGIMTTTTPPTEEPKGGALFHRKRDMLGEKEEAHEEHTARRFGRTRKGAGMFDTHEGVNKGHQMAVRMRKGGYLSGQYEGMGMGDEGCGGGARSARAAIVKKVMAEKGCSMIEASKYVKANGLYKGGVRSLTQQSHGRRASPPMSADLAAETEKDEGAIKGLMKLSRQRDFPEEILHRPVARRREAHPAPAQSQLSLTGVPMGRGGKKRRAPAGPSDGRRKRAEIVKKVMAEKGCSMIEASKYVKAHGLY